MNFQEVLLDVEDIRRRVQCRDSIPSFKYKQGRMVGNVFKYYRHHTAELELYPENNRHMDILKNIHKFGFNYAGILHDSDLLENNVDSDVKDNEIRDDVVDEKFDDIPLPDNLKEDDIETVEKTILNDSKLDQFDTNEQIVDDVPISYDGIHKKPHFHVVLYFSNARTNTAVAKALNHDSNLTWVYSNLNSRLLYLTHRDYVLKYQYSPNKVFGPLACRLPQLHTEYGRRSSDLLSDILKKIKNVPADRFIKFTQLAYDMLNEGYDSLLTSKYLGVVKECIYEHNSMARWIKDNKYYDQKRNNIDVPFEEI